MRLLDTSTLVAALIPDHSRYTWARPYLKEPGASCCTHSLAELYAVLSASPQFHTSPTSAAQTVTQLTGLLTVVPIQSDVYLKAVRRVAALGLSGGAIYDTLIAEAALSVQAESLVTLNPKHFRRLGEDVKKLVVTVEG